MKYFRISIILLFILFLKTTLHAEPQITVAVAANVQYAMNELKTEFNKETGIKVSVIIGSSGQLTAQIKAGAPYDVFISADMKYPNTLYKEKAAIDSPRVYAEGSLVLWSMKKNIKLDENLKVLLSQDVSKIALANPRTAPYGTATIEALKYFGIYKNVKEKLVYGESIAPTNQFIYSQAADAGFTAKSVVLSPQMKGKGTWIEITSGAYKPIEQGCVILTYGYKNHKEVSNKFYNFLFSQKAKNILSKFGYVVKLIGNSEK